MVMHSHTEVWKDCDECGAKDSLYKLVPNSFFNKKTNKKKTKVGQVTEEFIKEVRQDLQQQRKELEKKRE
tara:strand:- start:250 stop:459 length:210 start_codon:yes stop_codon:yes gene_type:complete